MFGPPPPYCKKTASPAKNRKTPLSWGSPQTPPSEGMILQSAPCNYRTIWYSGETFPIRFWMDFFRL